MRQLPQRLNKKKKSYLVLNSYIIQNKQNNNELMPLASFLAQLIVHNVKTSGVK